MTGHDKNSGTPEETAAAGTPPGLPEDVAAQVPHRASETAAAILERLAERLGGTASVTTVFGEPVTRDGLTVIPVAECAYGFGGGTGRENSADKTGEGGGGGGGAAAKPLGYIEIGDGVAVYRPIRRPWVEAAGPVAAVLVTLIAARTIRTLADRRPAAGPVIVARTVRALAARRPAAGRCRRLISRG
ncbi:spore germination protein GerW family protein [Streptomyces sp. HUAS MG47]|uniref:spore germination protein GerW family protein n=1 Tax=Streptomyces solicamelliae TaxID=3231716 RepID=UPI0038780ABC